MSGIDRFIKMLQRFKSTDRVYNPYRHKHLRENLRIYLHRVFELSQARVLLIGEAPGYRGCRITGIPFTSSEQITQSTHPFFAPIRADLHFRKRESENSAKIVWDFLQTRKTVPLCWNSFPFHPFRPGEADSNRPPMKSELAIGAEYLQALLEMYEPDKLAGVGRKGEKALKNLLPENDILYIRHPSHGGKKEFITGMEELIKA